MHPTVMTLKAHHMQSMWPCTPCRKDSTGPSAVWGGSSRYQYAKTALFMLGNYNTCLWKMSHARLWLGAADPLAEMLPQHCMRQQCCLQAGLQCYQQLGEGSHWEGLLWAHETSPALPKRQGDLPQQLVDLSSPTQGYSALHQGFLLNQSLYMHGLRRREGCPPVSDLHPWAM